MQEPSVAQNKRVELHIQLLGGFAVSVGGAAIPEAQWKSRRARSLVKLLALAPAHRLHRDQVIDALWPDSDLSAAANNFHQTLYAARRILEPAGGFSLVAGGRLSEPVRRGRANALGGRRAVRGGCRPGQRFARIRRSTRMPLGPLHRRPAAGGPLRRVDHPAPRSAAPGVPATCCWTWPGCTRPARNTRRPSRPCCACWPSDRSHEEAHAGLMRLYALSGQRQQALRQYQALREVLQAELDAEPGQETHANCTKRSRPGASPRPRRRQPPHPPPQPAGRS